MFIVYEGVSLLGLILASHIVECPNNSYIYVTIYRHPFSCEKQTITA